MTTKTKSKISATNIISNDLKSLNTALGTEYCSFMQSYFRKKKNEKSKKEYLCRTVPDKCPFCTLELSVMSFAVRNSKPLSEVWSSPLFYGHVLETS